MTHLPKFRRRLQGKDSFGGAGTKDIEALEQTDGTNLAKLAASYSDGIIFGSDGISGEIESYCRNSGLPVLDFDATSIEDGSYIEKYNSFYDQL